MKTAFIKNIAFIFICLIACIASSCQKDQVLNPDVTLITKPVADSASFTLNGKTYVYNQVIASGAANREANKKTDYIDASGTVHFLADKDTLLYSRQILLSGSNGLVTFHFFKKYAKADLKTNNGIYGLGILSPADNSLLLAAGNYNYPLDFDRDNAHNGIAIEVEKNADHLTSYDTSFFGTPNHYQRKQSG